MEICVLIFSRSIYWKISPMAPLLYEIRSHPGVHLVNPLSFSAIKGLMDAKAVAIAPQFKGYTGDLCFVETDGIAFKIDDNYVRQYRPDDVSRFTYWIIPQPRTSALRLTIGHTSISAIVAYRSVLSCSLWFWCSSAGNYSAGRAWLWLRCVGTFSFWVRVLCFWRPKL